MKLKISILLLSLLNITSSLRGQDLGLFGLYVHNNTTGFVSLSDVYPLSDDPDSSAIPDIVEMGAEAAEYFKLDSSYKERFFIKTGLTNKDKLFIIDYSTGVLVSFPISKLNVVAKLDIYTSIYNWPYSQYRYMIGFEIDSATLKKFTYALVYIGKENPFVGKPLERITWEKIGRKDLPEMIAMNEDSVYFDRFPYSADDTYQFKTESLEYYIQDYKHKEGLRARRLIVIDNDKGEIICERVFVEGESTSLALLDEQWTGKLFKDKAPVIFGLTYESFGCTSITIMDGSEHDLGIYCDNRH